MKILLDECVDRRLERSLAGHTVTTVPRTGCSGVKDGRLLALARAPFGFLLTVVRNTARQQSLGQFRIIVLLAVARSTRLQELQPLVPKILEALKQQTAGGLLTIGA